MGKHGFSSDVDASPFKKRGGPSFGRIAIGGITLASLTFVLAYYMPLRDAHSALAKEHENLSSTHGGTTQQLEKTTQQLLEAQKDRDELATKLKQIEETKAAQRERHEQLLSGVNEGLASLVQAKIVVVEQTVDGVSVVIDNARLFRDDAVALNPSGRKIVCSIARTVAKLEAGKVVVESHSTESRLSDKTLAKDYKTVWAVTAERAASTAQLMQACGVKGSKLAGAARAEHDRNQQAPEKSTGEVRIKLSLAAQVSE